MARFHYLCAPSFRRLCIGGPEDNLGYDCSGSDFLGQDYLLGNQATANQDRSVVHTSMDFDGPRTDSKAVIAAGKDDISCEEV